MVTAFRNETFEVPTATAEDMVARTSTDRVVTPALLGSAATRSTADFASAAQGAKADTALQPGDIALALGGVDLISYGLSGEGDNETAQFLDAVAFAHSLGLNRVICLDPSRRFKVIAAKIAHDIEIDLGGAELLGDFGAWGTHSVDATPIYWTKNVFYSVEEDAPSITLKNMTINGQSDHAFAMSGGTPIIDFRGGASAGDCIIRFENVTMTRGSNRRYTTGSGIAAPTLLLDYRNMEILVHNADEVWIDNCELRSSPGEMLQVQSDDARTVLHINGLYATKKRDGYPGSKWSSSALNVLNCHPSSSMKNSRFYFFTKGAVNWQMDGGLIESCHFEYVDDSNGLDFNEAGSYRFNGAVVRNCTFKDIVNAGIRTSGSNVLFENNQFHNVNICHLIEAGIAGDPAKGAWLRTTQVALGNITIRNPTYLAFNAAHTDKIGIKAIGVSATIPVMVNIEGGSSADRPSAGNKPLYGVYGANAWLSLSGYFGAGTTALVFLTGADGKVRARDCLFDPECGEGVHTFELNAVTMGKKALVLENCTRIAALDGGQVDFRNTSATLDLDTIHVNGSPGFAGTTNNAVIARDGVIEGSSTYDPASVAAGASVATSVTVTGARLGTKDTVKVSPSISPGLMIVSGAITSSNTVTVTYFNPTGSAIDLASHTITAYVTKGAS